MKKTLLFMVVFCVFSSQVFASGSPSSKVMYLKNNFTVSTTSAYNSMDVFGILSFLMQYSEDSNSWNYELAGLSWMDIVEAINGNPEIVFSKLNGNLTWKLEENQKVLTRIWFDNYTIRFFGIFDGKYFRNLHYLNIR